MALPPRSPLLDKTDHSALLLHRGERWKGKKERKVYPPRSPACGHWHFGKTREGPPPASSSTTGAARKGKKACGAVKGRRKRKSNLDWNKKTDKRGEEGRDLSSSSSFSRASKEQREAKRTEASSSSSSSTNPGGERKKEKGEGSHREPSFK